MSHLRIIRAAVAVGLTLGIADASYAAGNYEFLSAPQIDLNRIFRVDKTTGEVSACQYGLQEGSPIGVTLCYAPGEGAGPQGQSDYSLVASHHEQEAGVWRVDLRAGTISSCYVLNNVVVCTAPGSYQAKSGPVASR